MTRTPVMMPAFIAGWVDAGSFVGLHDIMAAHITGKLVVLAADIAAGTLRHSGAGRPGVARPEIDKPV